MADDILSKIGIDPQLAKWMVDTQEAARNERALLYSPYPKQALFLAAGANHMERCFLAGYQLGKTLTGAYETAAHLTGIYPKWWKGRRFVTATRGWAAGETGMLVRDVQQKLLCGAPGVIDDFGRGMIPKELIIDTSLGKGVSDALDAVQVRHVSGGISVLHFKSYEQGRQRFQGETLHFIWNDEEPDIEIYLEEMPRLAAHNGILYCTFTPLKGMSEVVSRFLSEPDPSRWSITMTIEDVPPIDQGGHYTNEQKAAFISSLAPHQREARARGVPMLGEGAIFQVDLSTLRVPYQTTIPEHWSLLWGIDFGINHPFAAVLCAWDRDTDTIYLLHTIRMSDSIPLTQAEAIKKAGTNTGAIPVAWPHDGHSREKGTGETLIKLYKDAGLKVLPMHATWPDGSLSVEAAIMDLDTRMKTNRFKIIDTVSNHMFEDEIRLYHRDDGQVVKLKDDTISALFKVLMMKKWARIVPGALGQRGDSDKTKGKSAKNIDFDLWRAI